MTHILVGTSGWSYGHWKGRFYPPEVPTREWLRYYSTQFSTVEINSTFYRLPKRETVASWKESVGKGFLFSLKLNKSITHTHRLRGIEEPLMTFLGLFDELGERMGPLLVQLPPGLKQDVLLLKDFLELVPERFSLAVEFRDRSWFSDEVYSLLWEKSATFCWHDYHGMEVPKVTTSDSLYIRMHGPSGRYYGSYPQKELRELAEEIMKRSVRGKVFVYFNNDRDGHAVYNAKEFIGFLSKAQDSTG